MEDSSCGVVYKNGSGVLLFVFVVGLVSVLLGVSVLAYRSHMLSGQPYMDDQVMDARDNVSPTPSVSPDKGETVPAMKWVKYKNNMFSIKYPRDWYLLDTSAPVTSFSNVKAEIDSSSDRIVVSVFRSTDVGARSLDELKSYFEDKPDEYRILRDLQVNGLSGFEVEFLKKLEVESVLVKDVNNAQDNFVIFVVYGDKTQSSEALKVYREMVSSFEIIDK